MPLFQQLPEMSDTPRSRIYVNMAIECGKVLNHMVCRLYIEESGVNLGARERKWER